MTAIAGARATRQPAISRVTAVMAGFVAVTLLLIITRQGTLLRYGFPAASVVTAAWIYRRAGFPTYLAFAWWFWFLVPGLRRIVDFQSGSWDAQNPISLAPFMVGAVAAAGVLRRMPQLARPQYWPWFAATACIAYGFFVGVLRVGPLAATHSLIAWLVPLVLGLAVALEWRQYPRCAAVLGRTFLWGGLLLSAYAVMQFIDPPGWDRLWVESAGMRSVGTAFPFRIRTFSLMNGPFSFAIVLLASILMLFSQRGVLRTLALVAATAALLLTLVRSAWLAVPLGLFVYVVALPLRSIRRAATAMVVAIVLLLGIPQLLPNEIGGPVVQMIRDRALTLGSLDQDISYSARTSFVEQMSGIVLEEPVGHGLGSTGVSSALGDPGAGIRDFDSGIFAVLYSLGWFAGAGFLAVVTWLVIRCMVRRESRFDLTSKAARGVVVASFALSLGGNVFEGVSAVVFWTFAGLIVAAGQWHAAERAGPAAPALIR